jgi:hypothetical protein
VGENLSPTKPKKSVYNSIMSGLSANREREAVERDPYGEYGSQIPMNRQTQESFVNHSDIDQTMRELDELERKQTEGKEKQRQMEEQRRREQEEEAESQERARLAS